MRTLARTLGPRLVALAARLVPTARRERWRREWLAEWEHAVRREDVGAARLTRRAVLSFRDALDARRLHAGRAPDRAARLEEVAQDVRFALRSLRNAPGFSLLAVGTIALAIGATAAIFSLVNGILLRPLPYPEPERLVVVWPENWFSAWMVDEADDRLDGFEAIAGYTPGESNLIGAEGSERIFTPRVTAGFFDVLGPELALGRAFRAGEDLPGAEPVVIVSHAFWRDRLDADPAALGRSLQLDGRSHTVVGVLRPGFDLVQPRASAVIPYLRNPDAANYRSQEMKLFARLRADTPPAEPQGQLARYVDFLRERLDARDSFGRDASIQPLHEYLVGTTRPTLLLLFGAVGLTLLIAISNVAGLLLARSLGRQREISVRSALGAGRGRILRQLLTESTVLGLLGAVPGLLLARLGQQSLVGLLPADTPRLNAVGVDATTAGFAIALALLTGWVVGLLPAFRGAGSDLREALGAGGRGASESRGRARLRSTIVLAELTLAVALVVGAGLLVKSMLRLQAVDPGFRPDGLITFRVEPEEGRFRSGPEAEEWFAGLRAELSRLPGTLRVSEVWKAPFNEDGGINTIRDANRPTDPEDETLLVRWRPVQPGYFATVGIRLIAGRAFDGRDDAGARPVGIVSAATARTLFGQEDPIGRELLTSMEREVPVRIIGVVEDVRLAGLDQEAPSIVYRPYSQLHEPLEAWGLYGRWIVLRTEGGLSENLAASVRRTVRAADPTALLADLTTLRGSIDRSMRGRRVTATLIGAFAAAALLLGAIGVYGVISYSVRQRWRELGIRVALGATRRQIVGRVLGGALGVATLAALLGLALSAATSRLLAGFLFEVDPLDPWVVAIAIGATSAVAAAAALGPAWRAGRADPARTLTSDG